MTQETLEKVITIKEKIDRINTLRNKAMLPERCVEVNSIKLELFTYLAVDSELITALIEWLNNKETELRKEIKKL